MKKREKLLADEQCELLEPLFPDRSGGAMVAASPGRPTELVLRAFVDFADQCGLAVFTRIFFPRLRLIGDGCGNGGRERSVANVFQSRICLQPTNTFSHI